MIRKLMVLTILGYVVSSLLERAAVRAEAARPVPRKPARRDRPQDWDMVDERADASFPASDPPGTY